MNFEKPPTPPQETSNEIKERLEKEGKKLLTMEELIEEQSEHVKVGGFERPDNLRIKKIVEGTPGEGREHWGEPKLGARSAVRMNFSEKESIKEKIFSLSKDEYEKLRHIPAHRHDPEDIKFMEEKGISLNGGDIVIEIDGKKAMMETNEQHFGMTLIAEQIEARYGKEKLESLGELYDLPDVTFFPEDKN